MRKHILLSFTLLITVNAYGAFDFDNYHPVAYNAAYSQAASSVTNMARPSLGYNMSFGAVPEGNADFTYYVLNNDYSLTAQHYSIYTSTNANYIAYFNYPNAGYGDYIFGAGFQHVTDDNNTMPNLIAMSHLGYARIFGHNFNSNIADIHTYTNSNQNGYAEFIGNTTSASERDAIFIADNNNTHEVYLDIANNTFFGGPYAPTIVSVLSRVRNMYIDFINNQTDGGNSRVVRFFQNNSIIDNLNFNMIFNRKINANPFGLQNQGNITNLNASFIANNNVSQLIFNADTGIISSIFIDMTNNNGGSLFYNAGTINNVTGNLIENTSFGEGGVLRNFGNITNINLNFINNTYKNTYNVNYGASGALYTNNSLKIRGNFINNTLQCYSSYGCNMNLNNYAGAIFNDSTRTLYLYSDSENYLISNNNVNNTIDRAIYTNGDIVFNNSNSTNYTVDDEIDGTSYNLHIRGDNTGYTQFNNDIYNANTIYINNGKMVFGKTPNDYTGTADTGHFTLTTPVMNLTSGTFDIANGYTETITLNNLNSTGNNNLIKIDLDINNHVSDVVISQNTIQGQINLAVNALSNLDLDDIIIWFAYADNDSLGVASVDTFVLSEINNLSYNLDIVFDSTEAKWGLQKDPNSTFVPDNPDEPDNPDNPDNPDDPDNPDEPDNPDNPDNPDSPDEPEQPIQPTVPVLSMEVVQMADYTAKTVTNTIQKLTNSMQKRVGELQWLLKDTDNQSDLNNAFWTRGIHKNFDTGDTSVGLSGIEFGYDRIIASTNNYKWYIGGLGYISGGDSKFKDTKLDISGHGLGAYLMVLEKSGWFADAVFRQHFINMETSDIKADYTASSFNLEIGKEFVFGSDTDKLKWFMKPSLEGSYISISGTDIGSFKVQDSTSSMASLSVLAGPRWDFSSGRKVQAYGKVGYTLDNSDDVDVIVNGINTKQTVAVNTTELGTGFDYHGIDNATNIYLEASYITGTDYSEMSGNLGFRYSF